MTTVDTNATKIDGDETSIRSLYDPDQEKESENFKKYILALWKNEFFGEEFAFKQRLIYDARSRLGLQCDGLCQSSGYDFTSIIRGTDHNKMKYIKLGIDRSSPMPEDHARSAMFIWIKKYVKYYNGMKTMKQILPVYHIVSTFNDTFDPDKNYDINGAMIQPLEDIINDLKYVWFWYNFASDGTQFTPKQLSRDLNLVRELKDQFIKLEYENVMKVIPRINRYFGYKLKNDDPQKNISIKKRKLDDINNLKTKEDFVNELDNDYLPSISDGDNYDDKSEVNDFKNMKKMEYHVAKMARGLENMEMIIEHYVKTYPEIEPSIYWRQIKKLDFQILEIVLDEKK